MNIGYSIVSIPLTSFFLNIEFFRKDCYFRSDHYLFCAAFKLNESHSSGEEVLQC